MQDKQKLIGILRKYFEIGDSDTYCLMRSKEGFAVGTITIDDFQEWDEDNIADLADYILKNTADEVTLNINLGDCTPEQIKEIMEKFSNTATNTLTVANNDDDGFRLSLEAEKEKEEIVKKTLQDVLDFLWGWNNGSLDRVIDAFKQKYRVEIE